MMSSRMRTEGSHSHAWLILGLLVEELGWAHRATAAQQTVCPN